MVASAAVSAFLAALGAYALYRGLRGPGQGVKSQTQEEAKQSPGGLQFAENRQGAVVSDASSRAGVPSEDERRLARLIYAEAASDDYEGKVGVGYVVRNRVESPRFPNTYEEVISERGQFEGYRNKLWRTHFDKLGNYTGPSPEAIESPWPRR
jgi:hypothetical protein